ncbi:sacsin-like [Sceloporus undulatus]|uniref:sacsin-like n=1 Tax=Sceloporus undulatus TaxID=8520 RepID=UPI001C4BEB49|nr:sacsin-like [Sceloporus undulatus]
MSQGKKKRKSFRQRSPPVLEYLQGILRKYPDGGQILKELIQNADDAGAEEVILLYDERSFGTQNLFSEGLECTQGPALLAYNNGVFSEADWKGIESPGISHKKKDPTTVGRFGLGFNSVYHMTDFPSILSGQYLLVLDTQNIALEDGGERWEVDEWEEASDQFQPFWAALASLGKPCPTTEGYFPGTLFRFPLRYSPSKISENLYSTERVRELLLAFLNDAPISLLFLRNVRKVTLGLVGSDGAISELLRAEATTCPLNGPGPIEDATNAKLDTAAHIRKLALGGTTIGGQATSYEWLVLTAEAKKDAFPELWVLADNVSSRPTLSLAYCLQGGCTGRLSCVLPLPATEENMTGLPLHISGPFQLTDDRRHVQWSEEGSQARGADGCWNHLLMEEMLPVSCCQMVLLASGHSSDPYGAWPDPDQSQQLRYKPLIAQICQRLMDLKLLVRVGGGNPRLLYPREAVILPEKVREKPVGLALEKALTLAGTLLADVPFHVCRALILGAGSGPTVQEATTKFVRETLRRATNIWSGLSLSEKQLLLEYVVGDGCYQELKDLPLLPMANGHFTCFGDSGDTVFVENQSFSRILLPGLAHQFLPENLNPELLEHLEAIAKKGLFKNLLFLNQNIIEQNFHDSLPKHWFNSTSVPVNWCPKKYPQQPPLEWLTAFWNFLNRHASSLAPFRGCPLIPLTPVHSSLNAVKLARLLPKTTLLFQSHNGHCLPDDVSGILETLGCTLIKSWEPDWCHHQLREYILEPTPGSVLQVFAHLGMASAASHLASLPEWQIQSLTAFLATAAMLSQKEMEILMELPLFFKMPSLLPPSSPGLVPAQCYLALEKHLVPSVPIDLLTPEPVLLCRNEAERRLLIQIRGSLLGTPELCLLCVKAMGKGTYVNRAQDAKRLMLWVLQNGDSLFSQSRELQALCRDLPFLDCKSGELSRPIDLYDPQNPTLRALLRPCQFPTGPFQEPEVLRTLRTLGLKSDLSAVSPADALAAAKEVNQLQEEAVANAKSQALIQICNETTLLSRLSSQELKQLQSLSWVPATNSSRLVPAGYFWAPKLLCSDKYASLVGLVMGLTNAFGSQAASKLGLEHLPPSEKVMKNLACLTQAYCPQNTQELTATLHSIYRHMQQHLNDFKKPPAGPTVWNGKGFSLPKEVVLSYPDDLDLTTLIARVPQDFQQYSQLFVMWGVHQSPTPEDVCQALLDLADQINFRPQGGTQAELLLVTAVLDWLCGCGHRGEQEMPVPVRIPGLAVFALRPASSVLYCDMNRARLAELDGDPPVLVHELVSSATAAFLGLEMLSTRLSGLELFEAWGPSEPVTLRIRNILREYSQDADVFQELLQNAEDAGAQTCHFLMDLRQHNGTTGGLLDPGMAACQGPALWAHNDALFSNEDFTNIVRLGAATKESQDDKIGHFGLGFCTVYHMTDVPSLLSGHTMLIFDPNVTHLRKHIHSPANPGIRLTWTPHVVTMFPEQFRPFIGIFGCKVGEDYPGTLIRLPFRTEQEAKDSQICPEPFGPSQIRALQAGFQEMYQYLLIFLHKVQEVSLTHLPDGFSSPEFAQPLATVKREGLHDVGTPNIVRLTATWGSDVIISHYLLHFCSAKGEAQELFEQGEKKGLHFSPPVAAVALPLCPATAAGRWVPGLHGFKGRVFCFLPLPIESGLPLHLTAAFAVLSNRKGLWDATEKGKWNRVLLRDSVVGAWLGALSQLRDMNKEGLLEDYKYYIFWPDVRSAKHPFSETAKAFYQALVNGVDGKQPVLFSDGQKWCPARHACILAADIISEKQLSPIAARNFSSLLPQPQMAVTLPDWVEMNFKACTQADVFLSNTYNWARFLRELVLPNLAQIEVSDRDALIVRALDMNDATVDKILISLPCIPTTPTALLKNIKELVHPEGRVAPLYTLEDGCFPMGEKFLEPHRLLRLERLGMIKHRVVIEELIDRARTVAALWHHDQHKARRRVHSILNLLNDHLQESCSNTTQVIFREIPFLPAVLPGNCHKLCCPREIYHHKLHPVVGLTEPVLDKEALDKDFKFSSELKEFLGLNRQPPVATVLRQLETASLCSNALPRAMLSRTAKYCYAFLNKAIEENPSCQIEVSQKAQTFPFVLVGADFVSVCRVACNLSFDGAPYLFRLPEEYQQQKQLWKCVGLKNVFQVEDYATVLQTLAKNAGGQSLPKEQLDLVFRLITVGLVEALPEGQELDSYQAQSIFFPDQKKVLYPLPKLHFDDTPWLPRENGMLLCHARISRDIATRCGVPTTKHCILSRRRIQGLSRWVTDFGAKENLCTRLANILRDYSSSQDVLKELLQNADDAGASVVHFLWDQRQHPTERTFSDEWNVLQGPALCIYNDRTFQISDIEGIQRLGSGGKGERRDATGKYGLGFNTVFHLTDCPAFITGDSALCVFDPTLRYLPDSDDISPGGKYSLTKDFKDAFPDVYNAFLPDVFDLECGTVFRLPLRTPADAVTSPIWKTPVSEKDMENMVLALGEEAECLLMFLNHVRSVVFSVISKTGREPKEVLWVKTEGGEDERLEYQKHLQQAAAAGGIEEGRPKRVFYKMKVNNSFSNASSSWLVGRQIGVEKTDITEGMLLPHGGVAACLNGQPSGRAFCTLPLPVNTGLPIHINGNFAVNSSRRDLRKDDDKGNVSMAWNHFLLRCLVAPLYCQLLEELRQALGKVPLTFHSLLACQQHLDSSYLRYFPCVTKDVPPLWQKLVTHVYELAYGEKLPLVPVYQKQTNYASRTEVVNVYWSIPKLGYPTRDPYFLQSEIKDYFLEQALQNLGMHLVPAFLRLQDIHTEFLRAEIDVLTLDPPSLCHFLKNLPDFSLPYPLEQTLMKTQYSCSALLNLCLRELPEESSFVEGLPLLVTKDDMLRCFIQEKPAYLSGVSHLFPHHQDHFSAYLSSEATQKLVKMGFLKDFTLSESVHYIQEMLELDNWSSDVEHQKWLREMWEFFETEICKSKDKDKMNQAFAVLVILFKGCPLLPVRGCSTSLNPLESLNTILYDDSSEVSNILQELGFAMLDSSLLPPKLTEYCIRPHLFEIKNPVVVLAQLSASSSLSWDKLKLKPFKFDRLLEFLSSNLEELERDCKLLNKLKALPVFETHQGKRVSLAFYEIIYLLESKISKESKNFKELYKVDRKTLLLRDSWINRHLSKCLGIGVMNDLQQFVQQLLPLLPRLPEARVLEAVKLLLTITAHYNQEYEAKKKVIVSKFQSFAFIRDKENELRHASYFYDEDEPLFLELGMSSRFVPNKFYESVSTGDKWRVKKFLRDVGLQKVISENDFLKCATQVERDALMYGPISHELPRRRRALLNHLLSTPKDTLSDAFMEKVSKIRFLRQRPISDELCCLHPPYVPCNAPLAPKGSLYLSDSVELFWTSAAALSCPVYVGIDGTDILKRLGVLCTLPVQLVLKNLSNVCQASCVTPKATETRAQVLTQMYAFLSEEKEIDTNCLKGLPVILVDNKEIAEAQKVVVSLKYPHDFWPYLYKLPAKLTAYLDLLEKFGVQTEPSICHYASVLAQIHEETVERIQLHPNLTKTVLRATQFLFQLLEEAEKPVDFSALKELHLPCIDGKLYPSNTLIFSCDWSGQESENLQRTFRFLLDLSECSLAHDKYEQWRLLRRLPEALRPKNFSDITQEQLEESSLKLCPYREHCESRNCLKELLISLEFQWAFIALLKWQDTAKPVETEKMERIWDEFFSPERLEVVCYEKLCTITVHNAQPLEGIQRAKLVHVVMLPGDKCQVYLAHQERMNQDEAVHVSGILAKEVNRLLGERLHQDAMMILMQILVCQGPQKIAGVLKRNQVPLHQPTHRNAYSLPPAGEEIPEEWHDSLDMNILHIFVPGDYVGYLDSSQLKECYLYAVVLEALGPQQSGGGQVSMYRVDLGGGKKADVSAHDLYHFRRNSRVADLNKSLVLAEISPSSGSAASPSACSDWYQKPLREVKKEVDARLAEIWCLSEEERKKAVRRLYLCYHPDKNIGQEDLANEIFKYLKERIQEMENKGKLSSSSNSYKRNNWNFSKFWAEWDEQAHSHHHRRQEFTRQRWGRRGGGGGGGGGGHCNYDFWSFHQRGTNYSKYQSRRLCGEEAKRWLRQAECDLRAAAGIAGNGSTEWLFYMTYRAVEKALTAVVYSEGGHFDKSQSLAMLARKAASWGAELAQLPDQIAELQKLGVDDKTTQYPSFHDLPTIPNEAFQACKEQDVLLLAREILNTVKNWLGQ